jgi:WhiB family redox-sensing transcriptional regulator
LSEDPDPVEVKFNKAFHSAKLRVLPTEWWMDHGACRHLGVDVFFRESGNNHLYDSAKAICHSCIHQSSCLDYALDHHIDDGIWGGLTRNERRRILAARRDTERLDLASGEAPTSPYAQR